VLAVEQAADDLFGTATGEAENVIEAARRMRERAVREIAEASAQIERALDDAEAALSLARWSSSPGDRRWRVYLRTMELGHPRIRLDRALTTVEAIPGALREQPRARRGGARAHDHLRLGRDRQDDAAARLRARLLTPRSNHGARLSRNGRRPRAHQAAPASARRH